MGPQNFQFCFQISPNFAFLAEYFSMKTIFGRTFPPSATTTSLVAKIYQIMVDLC